jgi:hypothetical protein
MEGTIARREDGKSRHLDHLALYEPSNSLGDFVRAHLAVAVSLGDRTPIDDPHRVVDPATNHGLVA